VEQKQNPAFTVSPQYWVDKNEVLKRIASKGETDNNQEYKTEGQKIGGTDLKYHYKKQLPVLPPSAYSAADLAFIVPQVLELTYTAVDLAGFAEDIWNDSDAQMRQLLIKQRYGADNPAYVPPSLEFLAKQSFTPSVLEPFVFNPDRRAVLRASLDARYAKLYGLTRDELRYILDPASVMGEDYPSETFRVLKDKETAEYGEYRTGRLVLEAWDRGEGYNNVPIYGKI
jgi:hypothetical protein